MASYRGIFLLLVLKIVLCDFSNSDPNVDPDGGNKLTPRLSGVQTADASSGSPSEVVQISSKSDLDENSNGGSSSSYSSGSWGAAFFYEGGEVDVTLICPADADSCVNFTLSTQECQMNSSTAITEYCFCTSDCLFFDDCCNGYTEATEEPSSMMPQRQYWSCTQFAIGVAENTVCIYNFLVVSKCPPSDRMDPDLVQRCEYPMANDTVFFDYQETFFRNRYCALCHGVISSDLIPYVTFTPCLNSTLNEDSFCGQQPTTINGKVPPYPRLCVDESTIISQCDSQMVNLTSQSLCLSETARVMINESIYKNIYCAICDGIQVDNNSSVCYDTHLDPFVFNIAYSYPQLICKNGFQLSGTECVPDVFTSWPDCRNRTFVFTTTTNGSQQCFDVFKFIDTLVFIEPADLTGYTVDEGITTFELPADILPSKTQLEDIIEDSLAELRNQSCQDNTIVIRERCNITDTDSNLSTIVDNPNLFEPVEINGTVYIMYNDTTFMTPLMWENATYYTRFSKLWNFSKEVSFTLYGYVINIDTCAAIVVANSLITESERNNVTYLIYQDILFPPERYIRYKNGSVRLCWTGPDPPEPVSMFEYSQGQYILSLILFALSSICLLATLFTYCIFKPLRNLQGICTMNFVFALLIGQMMLHFISPYVTSLPILCKTAAVISHYFLLAVFTWTNILAWDLVRHFASSSFLPNRHGEKRRLIVFLTIGWCLPLLFVMLCLVVQLQNISLFRYGKIGTSCWIYQVRGIVLAFLVPVAVSFLINIVLFSLTAYGVRKSKRDSSVLRKDVQERRQELFNELAVNFKISCLLGFGWSFGFIATFARSDAVWTIFIITSSLQGIFVFIFFGANQRVRGLWRKRIYGSEGRGRSTTSRVTLSSTVTSTSTGRERNKQKLASGSTMLTSKV